MKFEPFLYHSERKILKHHLINLYNLANADGFLDKSEMNLLYRIGKNYGFDASELDGFFANAKDIEFFPPHDLLTKFEQIHDVVGMMLIDGKIEELELKTCKSFCISLGFKVEKTVEIIDFMKKIYEEEMDEEIAFTKFKKLILN